MNIGSLFSGIGGLELGLEACGLGPVIWQCDSDSHARAVLATHWPSVHRYVDVREIDATTDHPDIICGGFPCQDISLAGKGAGIDGPRSGLWSEFARIIRALRPAVVFVENVAALANRGLDRVLGDLAALGFDAEWDVFRAADVGAPHRRERLFLLAYADRERVRQFAERGSRRGAGERAAEREHAEPVHNRAALADSGCGDGLLQSQPGRSDQALVEGTGDGLAHAVRCGLGASKRYVSSRQPHTDGGGEELADGAGRKGLRSREPSGSRRPNAAELRARDVADADSGGRNSRPRTEASNQEWNEFDHGNALADAHGDRREGLGLGGLLDGERTPSGNDADRRHRAHRFPPGPAAIAGWDGPQPAIRRGDDGVPGRSHRLRLLGNSVVPRQAALAWVTLMARAAKAAA